MEEAMINRMSGMDDRLGELKKRIDRKQRELCRLAEEEEDEETPPRRLGTAMAVNTSQEAGSPWTMPQEIP